jgi:hypothetical protein
MGNVRQEAEKVRRTKSDLLGWEKFMLISKNTFNICILSDVNNLTGKVCSGWIISSLGGPWLRHPLFASLEGIFESGFTFFGGKSTAVGMLTKISISSAN